MKSLLNILGIFLATGVLVALGFGLPALRETPTEKKLAQELIDNKPAFRTLNQFALMKRENPVGYTAFHIVLDRMVEREHQINQIKSERLARWSLARNTAGVLAVFAALSFILAAARPSVPRSPATQG